ncbi:uncharacterized protein LOC106138239 [Amyelois transitella]|uniref:uncharacterized protein LOC106138239 n=1 Tax=Amyelois transitella TaxID=680683 RepID=UPI00299018EF|nr:uncharacterized protein LOC106138239 [Amyelois transitella]
MNYTSRFIKHNLEERLKVDKGSGCEMPLLDPFAAEVMRFHAAAVTIRCEGQDWVKCYLSECRVIEPVLARYGAVTCTFRDIQYVSDDVYRRGPASVVRGSAVYRLRESDFAEVSCIGKHNFFWNFNYRSSWTGHAAGLRSSASAPPSPPGRENSLNVLLFAYDSASRNGFIRRMPKSYKYITEELKAVVLKSYNVMGDGTAAAMFPILTGRGELEWPDFRKYASNLTADVVKFIFSTAREDGYRTAYYEEGHQGTFQYRFNGFTQPPAQHYLRSLLLAAAPGDRICRGDVPQYKLIMNLTNQFFHLDGKKFALSFISEISHDDFNLITTSDEDFVDFLDTFRRDGFLNNTLLVVMGDHGSRFAGIRNTYQGKLEERLPLMSIVLPATLRHYAATLRHNAQVLTTPHDIHATILDAMGLEKLSNPYRIDGADLPRAMSLFRPIPRNRSCSEAGIEPHWCACVVWRNISQNQSLYKKAAQALVDYINELTKPVRSKCMLRTLSSVTWVKQMEANKKLRSFVKGLTAEGYLGRFSKDPVVPPVETYQVKLTLSPGVGKFEATMTYTVKTEKFFIQSGDISRTSRYGDEPACISRTHPHLAPYCFCADFHSLHTQYYTASPTTILH